MKKLVFLLKMRKAIFASNKIYIRHANEKKYNEDKKEEPVSTIKIMVEVCLGPAI